MGRISKQSVTGILVGDQRKDKLFLLQDLNGDGDAADPGEQTVFFDETNASGLADPTRNVFTVHQASDKSVYFGDGSADAVYRLQDLNADGDANDAGEAAVWFSADNAGGFSTVTPNGVHEGADGAIYIANAGVGSSPTDSIYRTVDLNGDGDANDAGEASVWLDIQTIIDTAVPFDLTFDGNVAYLNDLAGAAPDVIYRIEDLDGNGSISPDEVTEYISDTMNFGAPVDLSNAVAPDGSLYTLTWFPTGSDQSVLYRLTDSDGSKAIDRQEEAVEVWNASAMPEGFDIFVGFSVAADEDGNVTLTADGNVVTLTDLNADGDFLDEGETTILGSDQFDDMLDRPRAVEFYEGAPQPVASTVGAGNHFSVFLDTDSNTLLTTGENVVGQLGVGVTGFDIKTPVAVEMPEGFNETIVSVSAGQIHTTFLTESGDVYAFGFNNNGPLGLGDEETRTVATKIEGALDDETVIAIENGNGVSYAITDAGDLYGWGTNSNGQLGLGDRDERLVPVKIEALDDETVVAVSSGTSHTLVLTADGQVYAFGSNTDGQLGSPDGLDEDGSPLRRLETPVLVDGLPDGIVAVTADTKTSYAVTEDGRVFGWGESRNGQLLQGDDLGDGTFSPDPSDVLAPIELPNMPDGVIDIKGGARWTAVLTEDGDVYLWGPNDEGPTGGLDDDPALESDASFYPTKIDELDDVTIVEIQTGPNSVIAVADDGRIFTWGSNPDGRLGYSTDGSVYEPREVDFDADAPPFLVSATPGDNGRDIANGDLITLMFTEPVEAGTGFIRLINRDTGAVTEIDVTDERFVAFDGETVVVTPPSHLEAGARYVVQISDGAFVDDVGNAFEGIADGDTSTFNFSVSDTPDASLPRYRATNNDDVIRAGADDDRINTKFGDDFASGGAGNDRITGGFGDDTLLGNSGDDRLKGDFGDDILKGGTGNDNLIGGFGDHYLKGEEDDDRLKGGFGDDTLDGGSGDDHLDGGIGDDKLEGGADDDRLKGGSGDDTLSGGEGNDLMSGGRGEDVFVYQSGDDVITDFSPGSQWWFWNRPGDVIAIDVEGVDTFEQLADLAEQDGRDVVFTFDATSSLTLEDTLLRSLDEDHFMFV